MISMFMHPHLAARLADDHLGHLRRSAATWRLLHPHRRRAVPTHLSGSAQPTVPPVAGVRAVAPLPAPAAPAPSGSALAASASVAAA